MMEAMMAWCYENFIGWTNLHPSSFEQENCIYFEWFCVSEETEVARSCTSLHGLTKLLELSNFQTRRRSRRQSTKNKNKEPLQKPANNQTHPTSKKATTWNMKRHT